MITKISLFVGLGLLSLRIASGELRTWTDASGKFKTEAEFVALDDKDVTLRLADGKTRKIPLAKLSAADQKVARELAAPSKEDEAKAADAAQEESIAAIKKLGGTIDLGPPFEVDLADTKVTDSGLKHLAGLPKLQRLDLGYNSRISDDGLMHLVGLTELSALGLTETKITDDGLKHLSGLTKLSLLNLEGSKVTDAGLEHLKGLTELSQLHLEKTKVKDAAVTKLQAALPDCFIVR